MQFENYVTWYY